jgi:hypothetical protein
MAPTQQLISYNVSYDDFADEKEYSNGMIIFFFMKRSASSFSLENTKNLALESRFFIRRIAKL